jgi:hypothetical protein
LAHSYLSVAAPVAESIAQREQYNWAGWQVVDDDTPRPPEANPLDSAQARRAWRLDQRLQNTCKANRDAVTFI